MHPFPPPHPAPLLPALTTSTEHSRLPHSLGTAFLAHKFATKLMHNQPELELSPEDVSCVTLAGLCHDLGHGPFSHTFEQEFLKCRLGKTNWKHEEMSCGLLDMMFQELPYSLLPEEPDIERIKTVRGGRDHGGGKRGVSLPDQRRKRGVSPG